MSSTNYTAAVRPKILLVDDYVDALLPWEIFLQAEGFDVITAVTGPDALARTIADTPDLVVMDSNLPGLSGCEVAASLRSRDDTRQLPLIAATGYSNDAQLDKARQAGFNAIIVKPCDPLTLLSEIRRLLEPASRPSVP